MNKAIGIASVTGTVTLDREDTHPIATQDLVGAALRSRPCPAWCAGDCVGGEPVDLDGLTVIEDRLHEKTLTALVVADGNSYQGRERMDVRLFIERIDTADTTEPATETRVMLDVDRHEVPATADVDVREVTRGLSDWSCRVMAAHVLSGLGAGKRLALTAAELRDLAAAALRAAELLDPPSDLAEGR